MRGVQYAELDAFLVVARERSFRRAADALAVSPSAVSHTIRMLEGRLGVRLLNRTTRSVSLTEAGQRLCARLTPAFADIRGAVKEAVTGGDRPSGLLRLTVPRVAAQLVLAPVLGRFLTTFPDIRLEITVDDALVDSVAEGFDAGIRLSERVQGGMETIALGGPLRGIVVGSPAYLAEHGVPSSPQDLLRYRWLNYRQPFSGRLLPWEFVRGSEAVELSLEGPLRPMTQIC
jgi:DNA-binding transcriptional LysR family regulator